MRQLTILLMLIWIGQLLADIVVLKNGNRIEGIVSIKGDSIVVTLPYGKMTINRDQIVKIISSITPLEKYLQQQSQLIHNDIKGHYKLAQWCRSNGLVPQWQQELQQVLQIDPNHEQARKDLGYVRHEGRWLSHDEIMAKRGYIKYKDQWLAREEYNSIVIEQLKKNLEQEQARRRDLEKRLEAALQHIYIIQDNISKLSKRLEEVAEDASKPKYVIYRRVLCPHCHNSHNLNDSCPAK